MNDLHVVALIYIVEHESLADYQDACPLSYDQNSRFRLTLADNRARFELKEHYTSVEEARNAVEPFIRLWELKEVFKHGPGRFSLRYKEPKIRGVAHLQLSSVIVSAKPTVLKQYPSPPAEAEVKLDDPDVKSMYDRYVNYRLGKRSGIEEPLPSLAYFCLTMLEYKFKKPKRKAAANAYCIAKDILDEIGKLSVKGTLSEEGNISDLRKREAPCVIPLTGDEERFLENAIKKIIWRAAEVAANGNQSLCQITFSNLKDWKFD